LDEGFIGRTYRTSAGVLLLVVLFTTGLGAFRVAWSIVAGAALGLLVLRGFDWAVHALFVPERTATKGTIAKLLILKLPAMALLLYLVVNSGWFHLPAFAGGVALIQAVILLKAFGIYLMEREEERCSQPGGTSAR